MKIKLYARIGLFFLCMSSFVATAQNTNMNPTSANPFNPLNTYLNNFVQPAPNVGSLGKYADYPVGYYTGVPQISVPIYNLKDGSISLPISLSYHASGIRVSELASPVGLGWALNAGGMITRTVRGAPDEGSRKSHYAPSGYYKDHGLMNVQPPNYAVLPDFHMSDPQGLFYTTTVAGLLLGGTDCEPDLYTFNFNGHTGKFVFDEKGIPRLLQDDDLKIRVNYNSSTQNFDSWVITTADGIEYFFGENGMTEMVRPKGSGGGEDADDIVPSTWYLTRIVNPNTKESATFNYTHEFYAYNDLGPESKLYGGSGGTQTDVAYACDNELINVYYVDNLITTTVQGLKLSSISTKNFTVNFYANTPRLDLDSVQVSWLNPNGTYGNGPAVTRGSSLDSLSVFANKGNVCIKRFAFGYSYFQSSAASAGASVQHSLPNARSDTKRLKLTTVTEKSGDGTVSKPPYTFFYQESFQLPRRLSYDQDHWGFSNDSVGNYNNYFTPQTFNPIGTHRVGGAARQPRWPDMSAYVLTNITDPLGSVTTFTYGPNSAGNGVNMDIESQPADTLIGGLRIQQIAVRDNVSGVSQVRTFSYNIPGTSQTSGEVRHYPVYSIQLQNEFFQNIGDQNCARGWNTGYTANAYINPGINFTGVQILRQSQSLIPLQDANGNHIVYTYVKETLGANGSGGSKVYQFNSASETSTEMNSKLNYNLFMSNGPMHLYFPDTLYSRYYGSSHLNDTLADADMYPQNLALHPAGSSSSAYYPFAPKQIDVVSGQLLEEDTFDSTGHLVETVTNTYSKKYNEAFWIRGLKAYVQNLIPIYYPANNNNQPVYNYQSLFNALTFYKLHTGVSHLVSTIKKTYKGSSYLTETTNYGYESPYHTLKTTDTTTNSQGDTYIRRTYYSFDYANNATADTVFGKMRARNLLTPVSSATWKNGNLVNARVTQYKNIASSAADTLIYPVNIYTMENVNPLTPLQSNMSIGWSGQQTSLLPNSYLKQKVAFSYDAFNGKLINQQLTANINHAVLWDNQLSLPIAVVDNAANQSVTQTVTTPTTSETDITLPSSGGTTHYTAPIQVSGNGNVSLQLSFSGFPSGNQQGIVNCEITNTSGYDSGFLQLCIASGTSNCGGGVNTRSVSGLSPGQYTLTVWYSVPPTLTTNVFVAATYSSTSTTTTTVGQQEFYYQGFEQSAFINANPGVANFGPAHTGTNYWTGSYTVNFSPPANGRTYKLTYWYLSGGVWTLSPEQTYTGPGFVLTGGTEYDDIRVFPSDAQMTTYTYDATGNLTSSTDPKNLTTYYEYDALQRLMNVRDKDGHLIKSYVYHYYQPK